MAGLKVIGDWLKDSGWVEALVQAKVASPGIAESFLSASHVTRTRHSHQVTAASLYILLKRAHHHYKKESEPDFQAKEFDDWCAQQVKQVPQFQFWFIALQLELLVLTYVRSLRESNFHLFVDCLTKLAPWFFVCNHTTYDRWIPMHIFDMVT